MSLHLLKTNTNGALLVEMMVAVGILTVVALGATSLVTNSSLGTRSTDLGAQFNRDTSLVQMLFNNTNTCTSGFLGQSIGSVLGSPSSPQNWSKIPMDLAAGASPLITAKITTPGLEYTTVQINKVLEKISSTSYMLNLHIDAQKIGNNNSNLPGNSLYSKDIPMCVSLTPGTSKILTCGPTACDSANITGIAVGVTHTCAVTDGGVKCWGSDQTNFTGDWDATTLGANPPYVDGDFDTLGNGGGPPYSYFTPTQVNALTSGTVLTAPTYTPGGIPSYKEIQAGGTHTCAQTTAGTLECWGNHQAGQLGTGPPGAPWNSASGSDPSFPVLLPAGNIVDFSTGTDTSCAVVGALPNTEVYCWGCNWDGQLGRGVTPSPSPAAKGCGGLTVTEGGDYNTPEPVLASPGTAPLTGVQSIAGGMGAFCAIYNNGQNLACWGECDNGSDMDANSYGASCGTYPAGNTGDAWALDQTYQFSFIPSPFSFAQVALGKEHGCVLINPGGAVYCWGNNTAGQTGFPVGGVIYPVNSAPMTPVMTGVTSIMAGGDSTCALKSGILYCWGDNSFGQLGQGVWGASSALPNSSAPLAVIGLPSGTITSYAVGRFAVCAVINSSSVYCWGSNGYDANFPAGSPYNLYGYPAGPWGPAYGTLGNANVNPTGTPTLVLGL